CAVSRRHARVGPGARVGRDERRPAAARAGRRAIGPARSGGPRLPLSLRARPGRRTDPERLADQQPVPLLAQAELQRLIRAGSFTVTSFSRTAPSAILRFASPLEAQNPNPVSAARIEMPSPVLNVGK